MKVMADFPVLLDYVRVLENKSSYERGEQVLAALAGIGLRPAVQVNRLTRTRNIIVDFVPTPQKHLLFSAHYDVVRGSPGANDNASGVAVLLGLCRQLRRMSPPVKVVFFDREEAWLRTPVLSLGLLGSLSYVWRNDLRGLTAVYNLEICGRGDTLAIWPVKGKEINLDAVQQAAQVAAQMGISCRTAHLPWLLHSSDHLSFRLRGLTNAVTLSLLPTGQLAAFEQALKGIRITQYIFGRRPSLPEPVSYIHSAADTSTRLSEASLELMLSLLLGLVESATSSPQYAAKGTKVSLRHSPNG